MSFHIFFPKTIYIYIHVLLFKLAWVTSGHFITNSSEDKSKLITKRVQNNTKAYNLLENAWESDIL